MNDTRSWQGKRLRNITSEKEQEEGFDVEQIKALFGEVE